jgi:hypothetical protein
MSPASNAMNSPALGVAAGAEVTAKVGAVRLVIRGLAPAWIGSGGRNRRFVGR